MNPIDYLTTSQAAAKLGVSSARVSVFIREGRLPAEKVGAAWLIRIADLDEFAKITRPEGWKKGKPRKSDK